jgi:hypothetical protein
MGNIPKELNGVFPESAIAAGTDQREFMIQCHVE